MLRRVTGLLPIVRGRRDHEGHGYDKNHAGHIGVVRWPGQDSPSPGWAGPVRAGSRGA